MSPSTRRNGPEPTTSPWAGVLSKLLTCFSDSFDHTCSGTIGIGSSGSTALGSDSSSTTVVSSGAAADSTELR